MIISVDFDNTLVSSDSNGNSFPVKGASQAMKTLKALGCHIVIHTCRIGIAMENGHLKDELNFIQSVLKSNDIPFDEIHLHTKPIADYYIDDRAIQFDGDWEAPVKKIASAIDKQ
jgi:hypothetical protein